MDAIKHYHPAVGFCFFMLMIVLSLASMQPVYQCLSFVAALAYGTAVRGIRGFLKGSWWLAILILVVIMFNGLFGGRGLTVLISLNLGFMQALVTFESIVYGACMGLMLANVILWFNVFSQLSSEHGFIELFARVSPTTGMMLSRIMVFIPQLLAQAQLIDKAQASFMSKSSANSAIKPSRKSQLVYASTLSSHLMEWGMEKSLITAHSMLARGYGSRKRSSYRRTRLTLRDTVSLFCILSLGLISLGCVIWAGMNYEFYPYLTSLELWWGYAPYLLFCTIPLVLQLREELAWWRSK